MTQVVKVRVMVGIVGLMIGMIGGMVSGRSAPCDGWANKAGVCIAGSILEADFGAYQTGQPPPLEAAASELRATTRAKDDVVAAWHACEASLAKTTADERRKASEAADEAMFTRLNAAAPAGQVWSRAEGKYVIAPAPEAKKGGL